MQTLPVGAEKPPELRVLVVDDEALIRWSISATLKDAGHVVIEAANASEAVTYLAQGPDPDVIFLDYRLPDSQDLTLLEGIRRAVPNSSVIMMTAYVHPEMIAGAERLGAYGVISKPFEMSDVLSLARQAHASHQRDDAAGLGGFLPSSTASASALEAGSVLNAPAAMSTSQWPSSNWKATYVPGDGMGGT